MLQGVDVMRSRIAAVATRAGEREPRLAVLGPVGVGKTSSVNSYGSALAAALRFRGAAGTGTGSMTKAPCGHIFEYVANPGEEVFNPVHAECWDSSGRLFDVCHVHLLSSQLQWPGQRLVICWLFRPDLRFIFPLSGCTGLHSQSRAGENCKRCASEL